MSHAQNQDEAEHPSSNSLDGSLPKLDTNSSDGSDSYESDTTESVSSDDCEDKPAYPYFVGSQFKAKKHFAPKPCGYGYPDSWPVKSVAWKKQPQVEYCLSQGPLDGRTENGVTQILQITAEICTGTDYGAQVVVVNDSLVAKIFDPMYYQGWNSFGYRNNVVASADEDYSHEVTAYLALQTSPKAQ